MRYWACFLGLALVAGCTQKKIETPESASFSLQMATEGASRFEDYIHSLNIYAFRKTAGGTFVYARTLAELDAGEIAALNDASVKGDSKFFQTDLAIGTYELYAVGNANGHLKGELIEDVTTPAELMITGEATGPDSVYFYGYASARVVTEYSSPLKIELKRAVSKVVLVLYEVPVQIRKVRMTLGNIAQEVSINGRLSPESKTVSQDFEVKGHAGGQKDTIVGEMVTLPSLSNGATMQLTFYTENGREKTKEMPVLNLLPDKYIRVTGKINDNPGALLSFEVKYRLFLFDYWLDRVLPDFVLEREEG